MYLLVIMKVVEQPKYLDPYKKPVKQDIEFTNSLLKRILTGNGTWAVLYKRLYETTRLKDSWKNNRMVKGGIHQWTGKLKIAF